MKQIWPVFPVIGLLMFAACSAPRYYFVLIPDAGGKVGEISIENDAGKQILTTAGAVAEVKGKQAIPQHRNSMATEKIKAVFEDALNAMPTLSAQYIFYFKFGLTELTARSKRYFNQVDDQIVEIVNERAPCDIRVVGHTDTSGSDNLNRKLGLARARVILKKLIQIGLPPDRMEAVSHSEKNLSVRTPDNTAKAQNRRVEVIVH